MHIRPLGSSMYPSRHLHFAFDHHREIEHERMALCFQLEKDNFVPVFGGETVKAFQCYMRKVGGPGK